jgi:hypothetical protein
VTARAVGHVFDMASECALGSQAAGFLMAERARQSVYIDCNLVQVVIEVCNYANFYYYRVELCAGKRAFVASHKKLKRETSTKGKGSHPLFIVCETSNKTRVRRARRGEFCRIINAAPRIKQCIKCNRVCICAWK